MSLELTPRERTLVGQAVQLERGRVLRLIDDALLAAGSDRFVPTKYDLIEALKALRGRVARGDLSVTEELGRELGPGKADPQGGKAAPAGKDFSGGSGGVAEVMDAYRAGPWRPEPRSPMPRDPGMEVKG